MSRRPAGSAAELPHTQVLVLTTYVDDTDLFPALHAGARGYLTKDATAEEIRARHPRRRRRPHPPRPRHPATPRHRRPRPDQPTRPPARPQRGLPDGLTPREAEVLTLIAAGLSNTEIARTLVVSNATVKTHINHIFAKTGARDRAQAVRYAYRHGLTQPTGDDPHLIRKRSVATIGILPLSRLAGVTQAEPPPDPPVRSGR